MRKILSVFLFAICLAGYGQLDTVPMGVGTKLNVAFPIINHAINQINANTAAIQLKAPINNASLTGLTKLQQLKLGATGDTLTSITSDGSNIHFWKGLTELSAVPGTGSAVWGGISGSLASQIDLTNAFALKAPLASPTFTGTVSGITASMVGAMATSHAANTITATNITQWNTAYNWGNHALFGYALSTDLAGYVPTTRTINGHALSGNVSVTTTDLGLNNVDNTSDLNKPISTLTQAALDGKQATLVSATNIKTIGGVSLLGSGDISVAGSGTVTSIAVTSANGVSAIVTNPSSAADMSFTLGDITPTTVNGIAFSGSSTPTLAITGTSTVSGTNTGDNAVNTRYNGLVSNATHTGDVTGSTALTIASGAVSLAKMANMATGSLIYRKTAGTGAPEVQTLATLKTDLGLTGTNSGDQTDITGNAATATKLYASKTINGVAFDGSANISVPSNIAPGTTGNVLTSNGSVWTSAAPAGGGGTWGSITGDITGQSDLMARFNDTISLSDVYQDTVLVTDASYQFVLTDKGKIVRGRRATEIRMTVPAAGTVNFPVNSMITVKMDGTGIIHFIPASGVVFESKLDSVCINVKHGWVQLIKRATNKWELMGDLTD